MAVDIRLGPNFLWGGEWLSTQRQQHGTRETNTPGWCACSSPADEQEKSGSELPSLLGPRAFVRFCGESDQLTEKKQKEEEEKQIPDRRGEGESRCGMREEGGGGSSGGMKRLLSPLPLLAFSSSIHPSVFPRKLRSVHLSTFSSRACPKPSSRCSSLLLPSPSVFFSSSSPPKRRLTFDFPCPRGGGGGRSSDQ